MATHGDSFLAYVFAGRGILGNQIVNTSLGGSPSAFMRCSYVCLFSPCFPSLNL